MSQPYNGRDMDRPLQSAGSVKRARERAQAGLPRERPPPRGPPMMDSTEDVEFTTTPLRPRPPQPAPAKIRRQRQQQPQDVKAGQNISRPTQVPQWPLPGPTASPTSPVPSPPYRPPPGRPQQAPQRPPRPSRVPSLVDESRLQESTPVFLTPQSIPENPQDTSQDYVATTPATATSSSRLTSSSVGTIPDFPEPGSTGPPIPARRSFNLGPPPSSRRGASSFYSNASYVSPIPEESPRSRSHRSYASSSAMPDVWRPGSPLASPGHPDAFYEESVTDKSRDSAYDDFGDESKLVRSASLGKKAKPALIDTTGASSNSQAATRPAPSTVQPFEDGTAYVDVSTSSSTTLPTAKPTPVTTPAAGNNPHIGSDGILGAAAIASAARNSPVPAGSPDPNASSRPYTRLSAIRRPPKLDIDAVRNAEARGSLTSLPDLIRRATRLAAMIEGGKRPASRFEDFSDLLNEKGGGRDGAREISTDDRHQSGLSDMLAAFPPPAQNDRQSRGSWFRTTSWPLAPGQQGSPRGKGKRSGSPPDETAPRRRKCCGLPLWAFFLILVLILCAIAAAIVVPLEFFVFKNLGNHDKPDSALQQCEGSLTCLNGGTSVVSQGNCSCICTNGFTGKACGVDSSPACTTTNLVSTDGSSDINNVTLGKAIPRLIADAKANFSIPLSGTTILAKFSTADLSCIAENSLVTFQGRSMRVGETAAEVQDISDALVNSEFNEDAAFVSVSVITITPGTHTTLTLGDGMYGVELPTATSQAPSTTDVLVVDTSAMPGATSLPSNGADSTSTAAAPTATFDVTEEVLDFARVAVLYVLQEEGTSGAETAQTDLQRFFNKATEDGVSDDDADSVNVGGDNMVNLVDLTIDLGDGPVGSSETKRAVSSSLDSDATLQPMVRRGGSLIPRR